MLDRRQHRMSERISEQAAEWLVSFRAGSLSHAEKREYVRWLKQSPAHVRAMLELVSLDGLLRRCDLSGMPPIQGPSGPPGKSATVVEWIPGGSKSLRVRRAPPL